MTEYLNPPGLPTHPAYTNVVKAGQLVFITAQVATDADGNLVARGDIDGQIRQVWRNLEIALRAAGGGLEHIVATSTYITKAEYMPTVAAVRAELFPAHPPVTSRPIVVQQLTVTPDALVSIGAIAVVP